MLFSILSSGDPRQIIVELLLTVPVIIFALCIHETAHGYVAWKCGDSTAYNLGRLSLNPAKHLDLVGTISMLIFGYGWAKPVPVNTRNFRNHKRGMALTALAGPLSNLIVGLICTVFTALFYTLTVLLATRNSPEFLATCCYWLTILMEYGALINFCFAFFNLIPVPPFDGSRVALLFLPTKTYFKFMRYEREIMFGVLIAMLLSSRLFNFSPFSWLAYRAFDLVYSPVAKLFINLFF